MLLHMLKIRMFFGLLLLPSLVIAQKTESEFQELYNDGILSISAEKILYESEVSNHFFIHYQIKNIHKKTDTFLYLKNYSLLFYPNQWGIVDTTTRMIIDERRIIPGLSDTIRKQIENLQNSNQLATLYPGSTMDYYRDFNNGDKKNIPANDGKYLYVSMDGQLAYYYYEHIYDAEFVYLFAEANFSNTRIAKDCTVYFSFPLQFKKIPANSTVFYEN